MVSRKDSYTVYCYLGLGPGRSAVASDEVSPPTEDSIPELGCRAFLVASLLHSLPTQLCCQLAKRQPKMLIVRGGYWDAVSKIVLVSCSLTLGSSPLWAFYCAHLKLSTVVKWRHAPVWHSSLLSYEEDGMQSPHRVTEEMTLSSASFLPKD